MAKPRLEALPEPGSGIGMDGLKDVLAEEVPGGIAEDSLHRGIQGQDLLLQVMGVNDVIRFFVKHVHSEFPFGVNDILLQQTILHVSTSSTSTVGFDIVRNSPFWKTTAQCIYRLVSLQS